MTPGIKKKLKGVQASLQTQLLLCWTVKGLAVGALLAVLLMALSKFVPLGFDLIRASISLAFAGTIIGAIASLLRPISTFDAAFACDLHLRLKERLTSAIEFSGRKDVNPLIPALVADADRHAARIKPTRDFPLRMPRETLYAILLIAVTAGLYFVPPWQYTFASDEQREEYIQVQAEARQVREIAREILIDPPAERSDFAEEMARELQELARDMEFGTLSRREALERLSAIEETINQSQDESGYNELREQLNRLAQSLEASENLREAADALAAGDSQAAGQALDQLASDLQSGRVPAENLADLADALDRAVQQMADNPDMADISDNLARARDELRAAAGESAGTGTEMGPEEMAQSLIDAINRAIPEIDSFDIPQEVKDQATEMLESIREDLQDALDSGEVTQEDIRSAQERIQEVRRMLEEAGADLSGENQDTRTEEEIAQELLQEAQRLERACQNAENMDEQARTEARSTCQSVAQNLSEQLSQSSCSSESNEEARRRLDEVRRQLEEAGSSEEETGQRTQCSGGQSQSGQQGSQQSGQSCSGLNSLFGMRSGSQGSMGRQGQGRDGEGQNGQSGQCCNRAGAAIKEAGQCLGRFGQCLGSGSRFNKINRGLQQSRCRMSGACQSGRSQSAWGTGTSPYAAPPSQVSQGHSTEHSQDPNATPNQTTDYQPLYQSGFKPGQSYETQLEGRFTDVGGSYVFTEVVDPETGETSYVPYFSIEPTDLTALMDAVEDQDIPRSYADFVRFYFEQLAQGSIPTTESE